MKNNPSNNDDVIDSRNIEERIEELESLRDDWQTDHELPDYMDIEKLKKDDPDPMTEEQWESWFEWDESDEGEELKTLYALRDDLMDYCPDWTHGTTLIRESYWVKYCREFVDDVGDMPRNLPDYIESNINWEGVAEDLQQDYTSGDFDGVTYWAR
jgi:hypothetical protein